MDGRSSAEADCKVLFVKVLRRTSQGSVRVFVAVSSRCFSDKSLSEACYLLDDLEFDKVELWFDENSSHLKPSEVLLDPAGFHKRFTESTRLSPIAFSLAHDIPAAQFSGLCKVAKQFRIAQMTVPASPLGTPFNAEIDRLKELQRIGGSEGIRVSMKVQNGRLSEDPNTAVELCQSTPGLGITLDPSHFACGPHRDTRFDKVYPYVFHTHLRDTTPEQFQVPVGLGVIDYSTLIANLRRCKYNRALSVEILPELIDPQQRSTELRKLRLLLESLL
jgi:sugar phosphate isomerase/epimerase